jgi:hypothetical protein
MEGWRGSKAATMEGWRGAKAPTGKAPDTAATAKVAATTKSSSTTARTC